MAALPVRPTRARRLAALAASVVALLVGASRADAQNAPAAPTTVAAPAAAQGAEPAPLAAAGLSVPAGTRTGDDVVVLRGPLHVYGTVDGDAIVVSGPITVHPGGRITGDAVSLFDSVRVLAGGVVAHDVVSHGQRIGGPARAHTPAPVAPGLATWSAVKLVLGWFAVLVVIGIGVLVSASPYLDGVAESLETGYGRALGLGIAGQLLILPTLLVVVLALCVTLVGILAIPLAVVAFGLALAGLVTLGFLAVAFVTGRSLARDADATRGRRATAARGDALRALTVGLALYLGLWLLAAAVTPLPTLAAVLRTVALAVTWVAATAGFGAALLSRAGTRQAKPLAPRTAAASGAEAVPVWQTPTPVTGVAAARRPVSVQRHD